MQNIPQHYVILAIVIVATVLSAALFSAVSGPGGLVFAGIVGVGLTAVFFDDLTPLFSRPEPAKKAAPEPPVGS